MGGRQPSSRAEKHGICRVRRLRRPVEYQKDGASLASPDVSPLPDLFLDLIKGHYGQLLRAASGEREVVRRRARPIGAFLGERQRCGPAQTGLRWILMCAVACLAGASILRADTALLTSIDLGVVESERANKVEVRQAEIVHHRYPDAAEAPSESGRRIAPGRDAGAGWIAFDAQVDPRAESYLTLRIWGSDGTWGPLHLLTAEGGVPLVNVWHFNTNEKPFPDRWIYRTIAIPREVTQGRSLVRLRLMTVPTTGDTGSRVDPDAHLRQATYRPTCAIYNIYTHANPFFEPPSGERQGQPFVWGPARPKPEGYPSIEEKLLERARNDIAFTMAADVVKHDYGPGRRRAMKLLATLGLIYHTEWSGHFHDERIPPRVRDAVDLHVKVQARQNDDPGTMFYRGWDSHGQLALAYSRLHAEFEEIGWLDEEIMLEGPGGTRRVSCRRAYADFFHDAFEWRRSDRRHYTNQPVYTGRALYRMQVALRLLDAERALTEPQARWYLREALGLEPLRSREFGIKGDMAGFPHYNITDDGFTRELGYVDAYGELTDSMLWLVRESGDPEIRERVSKAVHARSIVRIPANDADGYRVLRGIGFMSWRGPNYPFRIFYKGVFEAALLGDPVSLRLAQLEVEHGRYFLLGEQSDRHVHWDPENTIHEYEYYKKVEAMSSSPHRLPMEPEQGDFAWGDEEIGIYAFRHGDVRVYGSFYDEDNFSLAGSTANSGRGIGTLGVLRYTRPEMDRLVNLSFEAKAPPSGQFWEVDYPFGTRRYEQAPSPPGLTAWPELPPNAIDRRQGLACFYRLHFGDYLIAMNTTSKDMYRESTYQLEIPAGYAAAVDVGTGKPVNVRKTIQVGPRTSVVLHLQKGGRK